MKMSVKGRYSSPLICRVCGDTARGINFDVMTCMSCKSFFRRNALLLEIRRCQRNNRCEIKKEARSNCAACRIKKCYELGMNPRLIQSLPKWANNLNTVEQLIMTKQKQFQLSTPRPLDLLQNDRSTLTTDEWNLLSNIIRSYNEHSNISQFKHLLDANFSFPPKLRIKSFDIPTFVYRLMSGSQSLIQRSHHLQLLSNSARLLLVSHNVVGIGSIDGSFIIREVEAFNNIAFFTACNLLYPSDALLNNIRIIQRLDQNGNLIKIMEFVLVFSSNCSLVTFNEQEDMKTMSSSVEFIHIQDIYVNMFWKYLLYLYGEKQAILRFSSLVKFVLDIVYALGETYEHPVQNSIYEKLITETERSLTITN